MFLGTNELFFFISICKLGSFKNPFTTITSLSGLYFRIRRFITLLVKRDFYELWQQHTRSWKQWRWVRLDLIFSMMDIYINSNLNSLTKFTRSNRSTNFKDILSWNISQIITKTVPISTRIVISYAMKWGISLWIWGKVNGNWDNMIRFSQRMNVKVSKDKNIRRWVDWENLIYVK